jgi:hypothetical protein
MRVFALLCVTLLLSPAVASGAKVYKWTDDDGHVLYSDQPRPGAQEIEVPTENAGIEPIPAEQRPAKPPALDAISGYGSLIIVAPANNQALDDPEGRVNVSLVVEPALREDQGHALGLRLDGRALETRYAGTDIVIAGVERGRHVLQAEVVDGAGKVLVTSAPVTFVQNRPSQLAPAGPPTGDEPPIYDPAYPPQPYPPTYQPVYPPQPYTPQGQPKPSPPPR